MAASRDREQFGEAVPDLAGGCEAVRSDGGLHAAQPTRRHRTGEHRSLDEGVPAVLSVRPEGGQRGRPGDVAYVTGKYIMTIAPPRAQPIADTGKWLVVYRRQPDGSWP